MAKYLFDTTVPISYTRRRPGAIELVERLLDEDHQVGICAIGIAEFYSNVRPHESEQAERLIARLDYFDITADMAVAAGVFRNEYARRGITLTTTDTIDATLVTANLRHFPMTEIRLLPHN